MDEAEDPLTGTLRDLKVDDRDLPYAKNYYDFIFNLSGNEMNPPWARQMFTALLLFGEICPVCSNKKWLNVHNVPKDYPSKEFPEHLVFLEYGKCPKCKRSKRKLLRHNRMYDYQELVAVWGQRSGKSSSLATMAGYHTHRFLKFPNFATLTNLMQATTPLSGTFVSLNYSKAYSLLWEPFINILNSNEWFKQQFEILDYYGKKYGVELYAMRKEFLKFFHKKLNIYPSHPDKSILRGDTRFFAAIDELALFRLPSGKDEEDEQSERANADEAHKSLTNSLLTVQTVSNDLLKQGYFHVPSGLMFDLSSPMSKRDKIMRQLKLSETEEGKTYILGSQLATWEVNPGINKDSPMIKMAYAANPDKADRDFGARPKETAHPFFHPNLFEDSIFVGVRNAYELEYSYLNNEISGKLIKRVELRNPSLMTIDAGEVNNSFTVSLTEFNFSTGKTSVTTVLELIPTENRRINHNSVYTSILLPLAKAANVQVFLADRWNSLDIMQRMKAELPHLKIQQISVKHRDFDIVHSMLEQKNLIFPRPEIPVNDVLTADVENYRTFFFNKPVAHLLHQFTTVRDMGKLATPDKGIGFTDDILRAVILGAAKIHHPKIQEILQKAVKTTVQKAMPKPAYAGHRFRI